MKDNELGMERDLSGNGKMTEQGWENDEAGIERRQSGNGKITE
jgi:hypothetical protein